MVVEYPILKIECKTPFNNYLVHLIDVLLAHLSANTASGCVWCSSISLFGLNPFIKFLVILIALIKCSWYCVIYHECKVSSFSQFVIYYSVKREKQTHKKLNCVKFNSVKPAHHLVKKWAFIPKLARCFYFKQQIKYSTRFCFNFLTLCGDFFNTKFKIRIQIPKGFLSLFSSVQFSSVWFTKYIPTVSWC